jgi:hypothetical protein
VAPRAAGPVANLPGLGAVAIAIVLAIPPGAAPAQVVPLRLSARIGALYPGVTKKMRVTIRNRSRHRVGLRLLRARAVAGSPGCGPRNVVARPRRGRLAVGARRGRVVALRVGLRASATDACQGATFRLRLTARSRRLPARRVAAAMAEGRGDGLRQARQVGSPAPGPGAGGVGLEAAIPVALGGLFLAALGRRRVEPR